MPIHNLTISEKSGAHASYDSVDGVITINTSYNTYKSHIEFADFSTHIGTSEPVFNSIVAEAKKIKLMLLLTKGRTG